MKSDNLKLLLITIFILIFGVLSLPQFTFNLIGHEIKFPNIDFSLIQSDSILGNFRRSMGIGSTTQYTAEITFPSDSTNLDDSKKKDALKSILNVVKKRIEYSNLYDVNVTGEIRDGKYFINVFFPEYYSNTSNITDYLVARGSVTFLNNPNGSTNVSAVDLTDGDIVGGVSAIYDPTYGNILQFKVKDSKVSTVAQAVNNSSQYFLMYVDNVSLGVIEDANLPSLVRAIPLTSFANSTDSAIYTNIAKSYFLDKPLDYTLTLDVNGPKTIMADYVQESGKFIGITFIISAVILFAAAFILIRRRAVKFGLMLASIITLVVVVLKYKAAPLSVPLIIGFIVFYIGSTLIIWRLSTVEEDSQKSELAKVRNLSITVLFIMIALYQLNGSISYLTDFIGMIIVGSLSMVIMSILNFRAILSLDFSNIKLPRPRLLKRKKK